METMLAGIAGNGWLVNPKLASKPKRETLVASPGLNLQPETTVCGQPTLQRKGLLRNPGRQKAGKPKT